MIEQDYHLLGSKRWRIKWSDEHVGARTNRSGAARPATAKTAISVSFYNEKLNDWPRIRLRWGYGLTGYAGLTDLLSRSARTRFTKNAENWRRRTPLTS